MKHSKSEKTKTTRIATRNKKAKMIPQQILDIKIQSTFSSEEFSSSEMEDPTSELKFEFLIRYQDPSSSKFLKKWTDDLQATIKDSDTRTELLDEFENVSKGMSSNGNCGHFSGIIFPLINFGRAETGNPSKVPRIDREKREGAPEEQEIQRRSKRFRNAQKTKKSKSAIKQVLGEQRSEEEENGGIRVKRVQRLECGRGGPDRFGGLDGTEHIEETVSFR
jgi:hypothetical protein